ncbi:DUF6192 family protein [Streptomyces sp. NPDC050704]|uniref:DUF6192 family protein n=1 Tax=Streptomyces sp. NPDC050704 TaxID=3157219 RepID=UPI0034334975
MSAAPRSTNRPASTETIARQPSHFSSPAHQILAAVSDPEARWEAIQNPPLDERSGTRRWTPETSRRRVGYHGPGPETVQEKVEAVHDLSTNGPSAPYDPAPSSGDKLTAIPGALGLTDPTNDRCWPR